MAGFLAYSPAVTPRRKDLVRSQRRKILELGGEIRDDLLGYTLHPDLMTLAQFAAGGSSGVHPADDEEWWRLRADGRWFRWLDDGEDGEPPPLDITLRLGVLADGQVVCTGMHIEALFGSELTARQLRQIRFTDLLGALSKVEGWPPEGGGALVRRNRPGPKGHGRAFFEEFAAAYRAAGKAAPGREVEHLRGLGWGSPATIRRYRQRARDLGILEGGPTT